jgi:fibronectin type 3 domain-containing protein
MKRKLLVLWMALVVGLALLSMCGSGRVGYQGGYARSVGPGQQGYTGGGSAVPDTFRIWNHHWKYPNTAAKTAGYVYTDTTRYTTINRAANGQNIRWGWINRALPDSVQASAGAVSDYQNWTRSNGNTTQDDFTWHASQRLFFVWMTANGLKDGQKVEDAYLTVNVSSGAWTLPAGVYLSCVLDTISKDYRILNGNSVGLWGTANNDSSRFKATWNQLVRATPSAWEPVLTDRGDYHDFGPRSATTFGPGAGAAQGTPLRFDVKDAVQQALDNGESERGFLFVIYAYSSNSNTTAWDFIAGNASSVATGKGNPTFTATTTSRRGPKPWSGQRVPVTIQFDDSYDVQVGYYRALTDSGHVFNAAACSTNFAARDWLDSLYTLDPASIYFMNHTKTHASIGSVSGSALYAELSRTWFPSLITADIDTSAIVDFSLAGGAGSPVIDAEAVEALYDFGYRSMRSGGFDWMAAPGFNHDSFLSWDAPVNRYQIRSVAAEYIFGYPGGWAGNHLAAASEAQIADELGDFVDLYYTNYGKAALVIYGHWYDPGDDATASWVSEANLRYFIGLTNRLNSCQIMPHRDVVGLRLAGAQFLTPEQVSVAAGVTADSNQVQAVAADQDSIYDLGGHSNLLKMWVDVPRSSTTAQMADVIDPGAPTISLAFGYNNAAFVQWSASASEDVQYYNVYRYFDGASAVKIGTSTSANYFDTTAINGSPHNYYVTAVDRAGNESVASSTMTTTPGTIISVGRPAYYALWFQDPGASLTSDEIADIASFDAIVTGPFAMEGAAAEPAYTGLLSAVRAINSDHIMLQYVHPWQVRIDGQGSDRSPYKRIKAYCDTGTSGADTLGYACNVDGQIIKSYDQGPTTWHVNVMRAGAADSVAFIWAEAYQYLSRMSDEYTGLFVDDVVYDLETTVYDAANSGDTSPMNTIVDFDNDNTVFSSDAQEKAALQTYMVDFITALRREFAQRGLPNRLIVANSSIGRATSPGANATAIFSRLDGNMIEGPNQWFPGNAASDTTWDRAFGVRALMTHAQTAPAMQLFQVKTDSSIAYQSEVLALANDSWVCAQGNLATTGYGNSAVPEMVRRLPAPGTSFGYDIDDGGADPDTLTATWNNYTARMLLQRATAAQSADADSIYAVWPYVITDNTKSPGDVGYYLSRSYFWPKPADVGAPTTVVQMNDQGSYGGDRFVNLAWEANALPGDFRGWNIYRDPCDGCDAFLMESLPTVTETGTLAYAYVDSAVTNGVEYTYQVAAVDANMNVGSAADSDPLTPHDDTAPPIPQNLKIAGGGYYVDLDWNNSGGADLVGYYIARAMETGDGPGTFTARYDSVAISAYQDSTALSANTYYYYARAYDDDGNISAPSDTVWGGWLGEPDPPTFPAPSNVTVRADYPVAGRAAVIAFAPADTVGITGYQIFRGASADTGACVLYRDNVTDDAQYHSAYYEDLKANSDPDTTWYYTAKVLYATGWSEKFHTPRPGLTTGNYPSTVPAISPVPGDGGIFVYWTQLTGSDSTLVYRGTTAAEQALIATVAHGANPYFDDSAGEDIDYYYKVRFKDNPSTYTDYSLVSAPTTWVGQPSGDPSISSVTGDALSHGETVTISGSSFGSKATAAPVQYDDFEEGSQGADIATTSGTTGWNIVSAGGDGAGPWSMPIYSSTAAHTGLGMMSRYEGQTGSSRVLKSGAWTTDMYIDFWWRAVDPADARSPNSKHWFAYGSNSASNNTPQLNLLGQCNVGALMIAPTYKNGLGGPNEYVTSWSNLTNGMNHWQFSFKFDQTGGSAGRYDVWRNGVRIDYSDAFKTHDADVNAGQYFDELIFGHYYSHYYPNNTCGAGSYCGSGYDYFDNIYIDNTTARVELGNASTYDACTQREIQIPSSWAAGSIGITVNTGSFPNDTEYWLFVIDEDGTPSAGKKVTITN